MEWFGSAVDGVRALPPGTEAQVAGAVLLAACAVLAGVPWPRWRRPRAGRTPAPLVRLHRPDLPWKLERRR